MAREVNSMRFDGSDDESDDQQPPTSRSGGSKGKNPTSQSRPSTQDIQNLFTDSDGGGIPFCIQDQELTEDEVEDLKAKIKDHGGLVVGSYRTATYLLVNPSTEEGAEHIGKYTAPTRRVVSWKFVDESISRGKLVSNLELCLFIKEDRPISFCLHESLDEDAAEGLRDKILLRGGNPNVTLDDAEVVIHSPDWDDGKYMMKSFNKIVRTETIGWLESCITRNRFSLAKPPSVGPVHKSSSKPGRKVGAPRNEFSKQDDQFLVAWMATCFGASMAGRAGNRAYQDMVQIPAYKKWSEGHTWQSWRERYKNKKKQLDPLILAYIDKHGTTQPGEGTDEEVDEFPELNPKHGPYKKTRRISRKRKLQDDDDEESDGSQRSNESYRPEKERQNQKKQQKEKANQSAKERELEAVPEEEDDVTPVDASVNTSSRSQAKKRARINPETQVIKTSSSQKAMPSSQKPPTPELSTSQKLFLPPQESATASQTIIKKLPLSQKPVSASQKPSSSQKPTVSRKAARRPAEPLSSPGPWSQDASPTPPRAQSPTPPPLSKIAESSRPKPTQSMTTTTTLLESQGTQDSTMSTSTDEDTGPLGLLDPVLTSSEVQAMLNKQPTVVDRFEDMGLSSNQRQQESMEEDEEDEEDEEEDENVEVGGVSQFPRMTAQEDDELSEEVEERLLELAQEYDMSLPAVKSHFGLAKGMNLDEALEVTRQSIKDNMVQVPMRGARRG